MSDIAIPVFGYSEQERRLWRAVDRQRSSMSKPRVLSCAYVHSEDVDPDRHVNAGPINAAMEAAVKCAIAALQNHRAGYTEFQRNTIQTVYSSMFSTHGLIRKVLAAGWQNPESIDALALARVPLEGLYTLCLMFENASWVDGYLEDGWKKQYVRLLLECEETKNLPRFNNFCTEFAPTNLNALRQFLRITDAQVATINHEELGTPMPEGTAKERISRFPSPLSVINRLGEDTDKRKMLERLYPEYVFLCAFAHGLPASLLFKMMFNKDAPIPGQFDDEKLKDTFHRQVEQPAYTTSLLSLIQGSAELITLYPADIELSATVVKAWETLTKEMLLGKAIWNIRTKKLLGIVDAAPAPQAGPNG